MTTAIIHGDPGSRKTATLLSLYGIPALYEGRTVVTNIRGFTDLAVIEKVYGKKLPESAKLIAVPFTREGFRKMGTFFHWAPQGALILMDEGQRVYPTRLRNLDMYDCKPARVTGFIDKASGVEEDISTVEEAFDCHRHMNWDIYISTPNIEKVHKEIRQVAEFGYRQKDLRSVFPVLAVLLGDIKRVKHNAETKGTSEGQILSATNHRIDKRVFKCYQSTATGVAKGTHTKTSIFAQPKLLCLLLFLGFTVWRFADNYFTYGSVFPTNDQLRAVDGPSPGGGAVAALPLSSGSVAFSSSNPEVAASSGDNVSVGRDDSDIALGFLERLHSWVHTIQTGDVIVQYFEVKEGDHVFVVDSYELKEMGFIIEAKRHFVVVRYKDHTRVVHTVRYPPPEEKQQTSIIYDPAIGTAI